MINKNKFSTYILTCIMVAGFTASPGLGRVPLPTEESRTSLFRTYDRNREGKITLQEFLDVNDCRNQSCRERLTKTFQKMDLNGDGVITLEEFLAPLRGKGKK